MTLDTAPGTRALLELENARHEVLAESLPGSNVPFWPHVRAEFVVALQDQDFGSSSVDSPSMTRQGRLAAWRTLAEAFVPSRADARRLRGARPIVHIVGGNTLHRVGPNIRNWLVGEHLEAYPEESALLQWAAPPRAPAEFEPTRSLAPIVTRAAAYARLDRHRGPTLARIGQLVREYARLLPAPLSEDRLAGIIATATWRESSRRHVESVVLRILGKLQPSIVFFEDASYGGWASLIAALKRRDVLVVEPQHGWIGPTHGAYNFGAAMSEPELSATLPDELLTFGDYWSSGIRVPFSTTAIGKPHLDTMRDAGTSWAERPHEVVLASSVAHPESTNEFAVALADALPNDWRVRFRPHPSERSVLPTRYGRLLAHPGVVLDEELDVYVSLKSARGVVGVASTVLFEAAALGCRVFVRDSPFAPYYVGDLFGPLIDGPADVQRIADGLRDDVPSMSSALLDSIWKPDAARNLRAWMDDRLSG